MVLVDNIYCEVIIFNGRDFQRYVVENSIYFVFVDDVSRDLMGYFGFWVDCVLCWNRMRLSGFIINMSCLIWCLKID